MKALEADNHGQPSYSTRYPALARMPRAIRRLVTVLYNLTERDLGLVAPERVQCRLEGNSPGLKVGCEPIAFEKIDPYQDA